MEVKVYNNDDIKLQGISYYCDGYKYWDLNLCEEAFKNDYASLIPQVNQSRFHNSNYPMALIDLSLYKHQFNNYWDSLSSKVKRDIGIARKNKFYFKKYNFNHNIQDFSSINHSQARTKKVNPWYLKPHEFYNGSHSGYRHKWEDDLHYSQWYGIFKYFKHYKQGELTTNERLFGYCKLAIDGELATIQLIWCHEEYLNKGLMFYLITSIVEEIMDTANVRCLQYYGWHQFPQWKSRMLFQSNKFKIVL